MIRIYEPGGSLADLTTESASRRFGAHTPHWPWENLFCQNGEEGVLVYWAVSLALRNWQDTVVVFNEH